MALNYADLFADLGKLVKHWDLQKADATALDTDSGEILDELQNGSLDLVAEGLATTFETWKSEHVSRRAVLADFALRRLIDRTTVVEQLGVKSDGLTDVLDALREAMTAATESINASSVAFGTVTANAGNVGNGTLVVWGILDGVTDPATYASAWHGYAGLATELCLPSDTITARCTSDSYQDGATAGKETFGLSGTISDQSHGWRTEGYGDLGSLTTIQANTILLNGTFEAFAVANTPDSWTITAGTAGTHIFKESTNFYEGTYGLKLLGTGVAATIALKQSVDDLVTARRAYAVTCRVKASSVPVAGDLTIQLIGTGYTAGGTEKITIAAASLPVAWTLKSFLVVIPSSIPSDLALSISWGNTPSNAVSLYIDDVAMEAVSYFGGFGVSLVAGSTSFVKDDRFTWTVTNTEGVFQRFFRRAFGVQLPSNASAGETRADTLAT